MPVVPPVMSQRWWVLAVVVAVIALYQVAYAWRSVFLVNLPVGAAIALAWPRLNGTKFAIYRF